MAAETCTCALWEAMNINAIDVWQEYAQQRVKSLSQQGGADAPVP